MKAIELVKNAIEEYGFRIVECDELTIMFRYQLNPQPKWMRKSVPDIWKSAMN